MNRVQQVRLVLALAAAIIAVVIGLVLDTPNAHADSASSSSIALAPFQCIEFARDVPGRGLEGLGANVRAGRLKEGDTFTDRLLVRNTSKKVSDFIQVVGYWSIGTLNFQGWSGEDWTLETAPDPSRYIARFQPSGGVQPGQTGELAITLQVNSSSMWTLLPWPMADHKLEHILGTYEGCAQRDRDREVQSPLVALTPGVGYGWGISEHEFNHYKSVNGVEKPIVTVRFGKPMNIYSRDFGFFSTPSKTSSATGSWCESWLHPDIRTGEVRYNIGTCNTFPKGSTGTMFPEHLKANKMPRGGHYFLTRVDGYTPIEMKVDEDGNLAIRTLRGAIIPLDVRVPQGQNVTVNFPRVILSYGVDTLKLTFFHRPDGWYWTSEPVGFEENDFVRASVWEWNHHDVTLANGLVTITSP